MACDNCIGRYFANGWMFILGCLLMSFPSAGHGAVESYQWRVFKAIDGLKESASQSVTISPLERVWIGHSHSDFFSVYNGYDASSIPAPEGRALKVYENRSGQVWTTYSGGLQDYSGKEWTQYAIPEIRSEMASNILQQLRLTVLPAERDHAFFLLSDALMDFYARSGKTRVIKHTQETAIGKFMTMIPDNQRGLWVIGSRGVARIDTELRQVSPRSTWTEYPVPQELGIQNLNNAHQDSTGGITMLAETSPTQPRVVVYFREGRWSIPWKPQASLRNAWRCWDGSYWGHSLASLFHYRNQSGRDVTREQFTASQYFDAAVENSGAFWLATSDGLVRYAPKIWQTPHPLEFIDAPVHSLLETDRGQMWMIAGHQLVHSNEETSQTYPLPNPTEVFSPAKQRLFQLGQEYLAVEDGNHFHLFHIPSKQFQSVQHPEGGTVRLVDRMKNGTFLVKTFPAEDNPPGPLKLELYKNETFQPFPFPQPTLALEAEETFFAESDSTGRLWIGTSDGLFLWTGETWKRFDEKDRFGETQALCMLELPDHAIWVGGLNSITEFKDQRWSSVRVDLDRVNAMVQSQDGTIWIASGNGIQQRKENGWLTQSVEEGLPSATVHDILLSRDHRTWIGTGRGISLRYPQADSGSPRSFILRGPDGRKVTSDSVTTFNFSGRDRWRFTPEDRLQFSWRMDDRAWTDFSMDKTVAFANLDGGNHRFQVRAIDRNWNIESIPAAFEFMVVLPWYQDTRLLFISICGLILILVLTGFAINRHLRLVRSYAQVERIVHERTMQLEKANQELLHSQKMRALGTLAAGVAHDFNNILSVIKGSAQIIGNTSQDSQKIQTRVHRIKSVVDQGASIVKALLGFSRLSTSDLHSVHVPDVISETVQLLQDRYQNDIRFSFECAKFVPPANGTHDLIQQMLMNLIVNAAESMGNRGTIHIQAGTLDRLPDQLILAPAPASLYLFVSIMDRGHGIDPDVMHRIFEPFFTTKSLSSRRGTGLGLSMVYEFSKELGYGLTVSSTPGKGSTFTVLLPVSASP